VREFVASETRFAILERTNPPEAKRLGQLLQADADERWRYYEQLAGMHRTVPHTDPPTVPDPAVQPEVESDAGLRYPSEEGR
jgi:pyruvate-ferredoxin/flavodoxin oxidoreductase